MHRATIRPERESDVAQIRGVNLAAFETPEEADIVERLRQDGNLALSLVAEVGGEAVGHISFSPVRLDTVPDSRVLALGPMAVRPEHQRQGVGGSLIRSGLERASEKGWTGVVLVGHPEYYPRFGFRPGSSFGLRCEFTVPDEVFMACPLSEDGLDAASGIVRLASAFSDGADER